MINQREKKLKQIKDDVSQLTRSPLYQFRQENHYFPVIGQGSHYAKIIFIGEAPGRNEAETGRPFCGAAGKILDQLLKSVKIKRESVYITNIVKDRPPENRDPTQEEIKIYAPFLIKQINIIQPKIIATLGRFSMDFIMRLFNLKNKLLSISQIHGQTFIAKSNWGKVKIIPFFHPAVALYNAQKITVLKQDFQVLKQN